MKLIFCMQIAIQLSYKLIPLILVGMAMLAQIKQNNKLAKSLQYPKKELRDEVKFCAINITVFCKSMLSFLMGVTRHA